MDNTLFEYRYENDEAFMKDNLKFRCFQMPVRIATFIVFGVILCILLYFDLFAEWVNTKLWIYTVIFALYLAFLFTFPYLRGLSLSRKRRLELFGDKPDINEAFITENEIKVVNQPTHEEVTIQLSSCNRVYVSRNIVFVRTNGRLLLSFSKFGFTKGTPDEFIYFLHMKGLK